MRASQDTDGRSHDALTVTANDHHAAPVLVSFSNTTQSLPTGTTWDLDVTLPVSTLKVARVQAMGPNVSGAGSGSVWREHSAVHVTTSSSEAMGHSVTTPGFKRSYCATYAKSQGSARLSHKVFSSSRQISLQDAWITGSTLRLRFRNHAGGSSTLWVKGSALLW